MQSCGEPGCATDYELQISPSEAQSIWVGRQELSLSLRLSSSSVEVLKSVEKTSLNLSAACFENIPTNPESAAIKKKLLALRGGEPSKVVERIEK